MKLKDIVKHAAVYLGLIKAVGYIENGSYGQDGDALHSVDVLTRCANLTLNELACAYIPMVKTETLNFDGDRVNYSSFADAPRKILAVKNSRGEDISFTAYAQYLKADFDARQVTYEYFPSNYDLNDTVGYDESVLPSRIVAYGVAAEYSLTEKAFEESLLWRNRYEKALKEISPLKNGVVKGRAFL